MSVDTWKRCQILFDANQPGELDRAEALGGKILELCVKVGGSITGEHGVEHVGYPQVVRGRQVGNGLQHARAAPAGR